MAERDFANNPFVALFPSINQAEQFSRTSCSTQDAGRSQQISDANILPSKQIVLKHNQELFVEGERKEEGDGARSQREGAKQLQDDEEEVRELARSKLDINSLIEHVFLITLDNELQDLADRPLWCVYMTELAEALTGQTWLDMDCLQQAVFERLLMDDPGRNIIVAQTADQDPKETCLAGESEVLRYLYQCYERLKDARKHKFNKYKKEMEGIQDAILLNARTCLQQTELYPSQTLHMQFIAVYMEYNDTMSGDKEGMVKEFFTLVADQIDLNKEDGSLSQVFTPVFDHIKDRLTKDFTLMHAEVYQYLSLLEFFAGKSVLAQVFMDYSAPSDWTNGRSFEKTLLGSLLSFSCIPKSDAAGAQEFFNNPASSTKQEHDIREANLWQPLANICGRVYQLLYGIIRLSTDLRHSVMMWLGKCLAANAGRTKIWSSHAPQVFNNIYCTDGFSLNLCHVMLKLSQPFCQASSPKLLKIQPSYVRVTISGEQESRDRSVHSEGLVKETCLIPDIEDEGGLKEEANYNFITECFFLTHQCLHLGFHMVHDKLLKVNQELHRIQRLYQEVHGQVSDDVEPARTVKQQMEKGMSLYLSMKAALTEPQMLEMSMRFYMATATWLVHLSTCTEMVDRFQPVKFPLPEHVPESLAYIPEFIMGNLTNFILFLHRFKDNMYETGGEELTHIMTLILVFMGSPDRLKNPHLRAELAETLAALMPPDVNKIQGTGLMSRFHREQLFQTHPLIENLAETVLHVFVSIEMTGQSVEFEQKFNYRRPMYDVLEYIWEIELHRAAIKRLAGLAEQDMEATDAPLFLRFINLLINDAIFLLDEALSYMSQIKEKQQEKDSGEWNQLNPQQRQEAEMSFRHLGMLGRYHNMMANYTIHSLELLTQEIKTIFCQPMMKDRIAAMLNYFLLHLVGPKQMNFKVKDKNEYEFKPEQIVSDITKIYLNLGESSAFCLAVSGDGRSYSMELFPKAIHILQKINRPHLLISQFEALYEKITALGQQQQEEEEMLADAPEEFCDAIMGTLMRDPVILPSSRNVVDRSVIARHILSDQNDPFNRSALTLDMVIPHTELRNRIHAWIEEHRTRKT